MSFTRLLLENLRYHWRGNAAVFLGIALGTAVLTGALFVGDSLRGSLRALTLDQLGWVEHALLPNRFFRQELADELRVTPSAGVLFLTGSARGAGADAPVVPKVNVLGVDGAFWPEADYPDFWQSDRAEVVLNEALAQALRVGPGATVSLSVQKGEAIPRETLLGKRRREDVLQAIEMTVRAVLPNEGMARFTLRPTPEPARNAFLPRRFLQERLGLAGMVNAVLVGKFEAPLDSSTLLGQRLQLSDWGLTLSTPAQRARALVKYLDPRGGDGGLPRKRWEGRVPEALAALADEKGTLTPASIVAFYEKRRPYALLQSGQMLLEPAVEHAAEQAWADVPKGRDRSQPLHESLIYLADSIEAGDEAWPYAVVAAVPPALLPQPGGGTITLGDDEIVLVDWPEAPLAAKSGDQVTVRYYLPDDHNRLELQEATLRLAGRLPLEGDADDPDWTPPFPGITDKLSIAGWETPPFPYNPKRIRPADESYWKRYRTTPKAYVSLATGQRLWASRFGKVTSIRVPAGDAEAFRSRLMARLSPERGGFVLRNVREQALTATVGSTDFGVLFLAFSFFLIAAALLLVGLLVRLNIDRRGAEIGLLLATGWTPGRVRRLLLAEGAILTPSGALAGLAGAFGYAAAMLRYLAAQWPGADTLSFLHLHATPASLAIGYAASVIVSLLTLVWATRVLGKLAPRSLLAGETSETAGAVRSRRRRLAPLVLLAAGLGALTCVVLGQFAESSEARAGSFFGAGALLLTATLAAVWLGLRRTAGASRPQPTLSRLGFRNAGRHAVRSLLTVGLLAAATFLIVAVESFHKDVGAGFLDKAGGSGGFALIAETDVPIFQDLNDPKTRVDWDLSEERLKRLGTARYVACRVKAGDDASCLNLYRPLEPRVLGVPAALLREGRFHFGGTLAQTPEEKANPWLLLEKPAEDGVVPAIVDANTAQWILKVGLGETIAVMDDHGAPAKLRVVGLLRESIFQSEVVIAESAFRNLFPRREGFQFFLIEAPADEVAAIQTDLQAALADQGAEVITTTRRLSEYLAVEHTYLDTFKALGGLGLLLGAFGLAIVLLRGVWERRGELALLRALGFARWQLAWLVLAENVALLVLGLAVGTAAAGVAVLPHLTATGHAAAGTLLLRLALLLGLVSLIGLGSGLFAVLSSLRTPLLTALRRE